MPTQNHKETSATYAYMQRSLISSNYETILKSHKILPKPTYLPRRIQDLESVGLQSIIYVHFETILE